MLSKRTQTNRRREESVPDGTKAGGNNEEVAQVHELELRTRAPEKLTKRSRENADMKDMITTLLNEDEGDEVNLAFQAMAKHMKR